MSLIALIEECGIPDSTTENRESFRIETKDQAIWAMKKISKAKAAMQENADAAQEEIIRVNKWLESENRSLESEISFFTTLLESYAYKAREADPKVKSIKLPHGTLKFRTQQPEYTRNNEALLKWIKENRPEFVRTKEEPDWSGLKEVAKVQGDCLIDPESGEVIDGVTVTERPEKFSVEVV